MPKTDWRSWCAVDNLQAGATSVTCWFGRVEESRKHVVRVIETDEDFTLEATIVGSSVLEQLDRPAQLDAWKRNRVIKLVGCRVDGRGRLLAEARVPKFGLKAEEFRTYVMAVAAEADRLELVLTGKDSQ